ncbi:type VI secretion system baseplate subunit TssE [Pseudomonas sp. HR96]|uniref:type VI secretion system baseplate subunit TssE n=1 Tax=Pseudomonas sp. HR96 TaxID=1027966 RepID=UPI002A75EFA8|nr:type VI secretion system baseplate subunit TssE [Pseudomonas sp. HR96]WPO98785.1 type VI secretion system baseplate subunit TssE [Pseudomonas sp. HR96]
MHHGASLFERLGAAPRPLHSRTPEAQLRERVAAIKAHLEQLLNTRQGCSQSSPELGLADFNSQTGSTDLMTRIGADIRRTLGTYEPRLQILRLHSSSDPGSPLELNFRLDCQVLLDQRHQPVQIDLTVDHRHTRVK